MAADESAVKEYLAIFVKSAGYLYRAALCHAGDGPGAARMLEEALWTVFQREGVVYKKPAFRSEVVGEMELKNGGADWPRLTVEAALDRIRDREGGDEFRKALHAALLKCPAPDVRGLLRAFETRAREYREPNRLLTRVFGGLVFSTASYDYMVHSKASFHDHITKNKEFEGDEPVVISFAFAAASPRWRRGVATAIR